MFRLTGNGCHKVTQKASWHSRSRSCALSLSLPLALLPCKAHDTLVSILPVLFYQVLKNKDH